MNTHYNFRRILLAMRADWMEYKKNYLFTMGVLFLVWMLLLFIIHISRTPSMGMPASFWGIGMFVALISFCQHAGRKMHRQKGRFLMLPASNGEKYTALLLEGLAYFAGLQLVFWLGYGIWKPFTPALSISLSSISVNPTGGEGAIYLLSALLFLSYMTFRKYAALIAISGLSVYLAFFIAAVAQVVVNANFTRGYFESFYLYDAIVFQIKYFMPAMIVATLVVMYVAYLKLKEKELR
jgi:hypothetical protein